MHGHLETRCQRHAIDQRVESEANCQHDPAQRAFVQFASNRRLFIVRVLMVVVRLLIDRSMMMDMKNPGQEEHPHQACQYGHGTCIDRAQLKCGVGQHV